MCGLVATLGVSQPLARALDRLAHRGPDGAGRWRSDDGQLALGHRRLAVVGGPEATQPVVDPTSGVAAILNGQLYGWRAHARALRTLYPGDSGILPGLYHALGDALGESLRGEFALVIADPGRRRLLALRDPFGTKPLYWARLGDGIALASEIRGLRALGLRTQLSARALRHAFAHQYLPPGLSMVEGVGLLPPGGRLVAELGANGVSVVVDRWTTRAWSSEELIPSPDALLGVLDEAVALRLEADRPVGALLSGGMDSAAIVDSAVRQRGPLPCFTVRFPGQGYDEGPAAEVFARDRGCPLHTVSVSHADLLEHLPVAVASAEGLCINGQLVARRLLARRVRQEGVVVVLSGEGSDEVALGYPHLALDGGAALGELASVHGPQAGVMLPSGRTVGTAAFERSLGWTPSFLRAKLAFGDRLLCLVDPEFRAAGPDPVDVLADSLEALPLAGHPPAQQASALWMELCLAGYILRGISDAQDMAEGVESRPPFLDPAVWALARCIPARAQLEGGLGKQVLRRALAPRLGSVAARPKHPFLAPPLLGALAGDRALYDGVRGQLQGLVQVPGVDGRAVSSWLEDSVAVPLPGAELAARDAVLWTLMSAAALADSLGEAA